MIAGRGPKTHAQRFRDSQRSRARSALGIRDRNRTHGELGIHKGAARTWSRVAARSYMRSALGVREEDAHAGR